MSCIKNRIHIFVDIIVLIPECYKVLWKIFSKSLQMCLQSSCKYLNAKMQVVLRLQ